MSTQLTGKAAPQLSIKAQTSAAATVNGSAVDMLGWAEAVIVLNCGTCDASTTLDVKITEDTAAAFDDDPQDVTGAAFTQVLPANDDAIFVARLNSDALTDRYIRVTAVVGGSGSALFSAIVIPYGPVGSQSELPATLDFDL